MRRLVSDQQFMSRRSVTVMCAYVRASRGKGEGGGEGGGLESMAKVMVMNAWACW